MNGLKIFPYKPYKLFPKTDENEELRRISVGRNHLSHMRTLEGLNCIFPDMNLKPSEEDPNKPILEEGFSLFGGKKQVAQKKSKTHPKLKKKNSKTFSTGLFVERKTTVDSIKPHKAHKVKKNSCLYSSVVKTSLKPVEDIDLQNSKDQHSEETKEQGTLNLLDNNSQCPNEKIDSEIPYQNYEHDEVQFEEFINIMEYSEFIRNPVIPLRLSFSKSDFSLFWATVKPYYEEIFRFNNDDEPWYIKYYFSTGRIIIQRCTQQYSIYDPKMWPAKGPF